MSAERKSIDLLAELRRQGVTGRVYCAIEHMLDAARLPNACVVAGTGYIEVPENEWREFRDALAAVRGGA